MTLTLTKETLERWRINKTEWPEYGLPNLSDSTTEVEAAILETRPAKDIRISPLRPRSPEEILRSGGKPWTKEETDLAIELYVKQDKSGAEIAAVLGRSRNSVISRLARFGPKLSPEEITRRKALNAANTNFTNRSNQAAAKKHKGTQKRAVRGRPKK